ncbi:glial cell line-derived neurotrophic factor-like [Corythoichthys intestinalis]|uniref:glial cell line-derived neurotrophic factor-like n=1 Tax=Corythoichthys intestinalis TaxID=161448 RepID=UPI0025A5B7D7|nr:glial cell line-derived neurotrophic factor-like [Corythoichthys intestinalis]XP_061803778.1 glial cell line-derived neurotrophic factor-like [Nerophis lumbriciformis]
MTLWHSLTTCLFVLGAVHAGPGPQGVVVLEEARPLESPPLRIRLSVTSQGGNRQDMDDRGDAYIMGAPIPADFDKVEDLIKVTISRIRGSPTESSRARSIRSRPKRKRMTGSSYRRNPGGRERKSGGRRAPGCALKQVQLNVTDLGLGYISGEEMIFRYCAGTCRKSETNYDKIIRHLARGRRLPAKDVPLQACCRPVAFDDNLSFLDDNLVYHTLRKHSARKCACV